AFGKWWKAFRSWYLKARRKAPSRHASRSDHRARRNFRVGPERGGILAFARTRLQRNRADGIGGPQQAAIPERRRSEELQTLRLFRREAGRLHRPLCAIRAHRR